MPPIGWLQKAEQIACSFSRTTSGRHHVYAVLLKGYAKNSLYGVYIGESAFRPETRFRNHKAGQDASRHVHRKGICLLPSLYAHLNPLSREEAKIIEQTLADSLRTAGLNVRGGH